MGKRLFSQRRGRGRPRYKAPSHRFAAEAKIPAFDAEGEVVNLVDCPGHTALLMQVRFDNGKTAHMIAPEGIAIGDRIAVGSGHQPTVGSALPLKEIPEGSYVFNIEKVPGDGGRFARASGAAGMLLSKDEKYAYVRMPSKKVVTFSLKARAQIGVPSGAGRTDKPLLKAGNAYYKYRARNRKWPKLRGVKMSPYNHPFGGKEHHPGKGTCSPRNAPPGRKVGHIAARMTGRKSKKTVRK